MKILQVVGFFSPARGGGVTAVVYQLSKALAQRGHDVTIYTSDFELDMDYINSLKGVKVHPFHSYFSIGGRPLLIPDLVKQAKEHLKDFDVIHVHGYRGFMFFVIRNYALKYGVPYVVDPHGVVANKNGAFSRLVDVLFSNRVLKKASGAIAETELGAAEYRNAGVSQDRIAILYPPFPVEDYASLPPRGRFREKFNIKVKHIITFLGRINQIKGVGFLVESFYELSKKRDDVILAIIGTDDGYKANLDEMINRYNLSGKVLFTGYMGGEAKTEALVDSDMLVQPSVYEQGLPWASLEAVLCGSAIIVSKNTGAAEDALRMGAGYLVEHGNKDELRDTMQYILEHPGEAAANTEKAKNYITANMSMQKKVAEYEGIYDSCIKRTI